MGVQTVSDNDRYQLYLKHSKPITFDDWYANHRRYRDDMTWWHTHDRYHRPDTTDQQRLNTEVDRNFHQNPAKGASGWIAPDGEFIGCSFGGHLPAIIVFKGMSELDAETALYVKACGTRNCYWHDTYKLTDAQKAVLAKLRIKLTSKGF